MLYYRITTFIIFFSSGMLFSEVVYLKDGQVFNGAVVKEDKDFIWVKTKYQEKKINRKEILRMLYGERDLEPIYIQLKDNRIISGFLVDQDNKKVVIRIQKTSKNETSIAKVDIQQMSREKIIPLEPDVFISPKWFMPLNTDSGANLKGNIFVEVGYGIKIPAVSGLRILGSLGIANNSSTFTDVKGKTRNQSLQSIPILLSAFYYYPLDNLLGSSKSASSSEKDNKVTLLDKRSHWSSYFNLIGRLGFGPSFLVFDNGEGEKFSGLKFTSVVGLGVSWEVIKRKLFLLPVAEMFVFFEKDGSMLYNLAITMSISYRY